MATTTSRTRLFNTDGSGGSWWDDLFGDRGDDEFPDVPDMPGGGDDDGGFDLGDLGGFLGGGRGDTQQTRSYNVNLNLPTDLDRAAHAAQFAAVLAGGEGPFAAAYLPDWYAEYAKGVDRSGGGSGGDGDGNPFGGFGGGGANGAPWFTFPEWMGRLGHDAMASAGRGAAMGPADDEYAPAGTGATMSPMTSFGGGGYGGVTYGQLSGGLNLGGFQEFDWTPDEPVATLPYEQVDPNMNPWAPPAPAAPTSPAPTSPTSPAPTNPTNPVYQGGNQPGAEMLPDVPEEYEVNTGFDDPFGRFSNEMSKAIDIRGIQEVARATTPGFADLVEEGDYWTQELGGEPIDEYGALWANPGLAADNYWNMSPMIMERLRQMNAAAGITNAEYDHRLRQYLPGGTAAARITR